MVHFERMRHNDLPLYEDRLFPILRGNMAEYVDYTGDEAAKRAWSDGVTASLTYHRRNLILMYSDEEIIGFFLYCLRDDALVIEDMQIAPEWQGKSNIFWLLFNFLFSYLPETLSVIRAKTKKRNAKAHGIILHLGLRIVGETENSYLYEGRYEDFLRWFKRK